MRSLILIFFVFLTSFADGSLDPSLDEFQILVTEAKQNKPDSVKKLELFYQKVESDHLKVSAAYLLAFYSEEKLSLFPPEIYADFVINNHKGLSQKDQLRMTQIAADGYFKKAKFKKAKNLYLSGIEMSGISKNQQRHFYYNLSWTLLNMGETLKAYESLKTYLAKHYDGDSTHEDVMYMDLGRFYAEAGLKNKGKITSLPDINQLDKESVRSFFKGVLLGQRRLKNDESSVLELFSDSGWEKHIYPEMQSQMRKKFENPCKIFSLVKDKNTHLWNADSLKSAILFCANSPEFSQKKHLLAFTKWFASLMDKSVKDNIVLAHLKKKSGLTKESCDQWLKIAEKMSDKSQLSSKDWLIEAADVCINNEGTHLGFANFLADKDKFIDDDESIYFLLSHERFPESYKWLLIEKAFIKSDLSYKILAAIEYMGISRAPTGILKQSIEYLFEDPNEQRRLFGAKALMFIKDQDYIKKYFSHYYSSIKNDRNGLWNDFVKTVVSEPNTLWVKEAIESIGDSRERSDMTYLTKVLSSPYDMDWGPLQQLFKNTAMKNEYKKLNVLFSRQSKLNSLVADHGEIESIIANLAKSIQIASQQRWQSLKLKSISQNILIKQIDSLIGNEELKKNNGDEWPIIVRELKVWKKKII